MKHVAVATKEEAFSIVRALHAGFLALSAPSLGLKPDDASWLQLDVTRALDLHPEALAEAEAALNQSNLAN